MSVRGIAPLSILEAVYDTQRYCNYLRSEIDSMEPDARMWRLMSEEDRQSILNKLCVCRRAYAVVDGMCEACNRRHEAWGEFLRLISEPKYNAYDQWQRSLSGRSSFRRGLCDER